MPLAEGILRVSVLFNEPKLLKCPVVQHLRRHVFVSVLFNEPKLLKSRNRDACLRLVAVSVLFNEPKLLKSNTRSEFVPDTVRFRALQRAEIAEIELGALGRVLTGAFQCSSTSRNC